MGGPERQLPFPLEDQTISLKERTRLIRHSILLARKRLSTLQEETSLNSDMLDVVTSDYFTVLFYLNNRLGIPPEKALY